MMGIKQKDDKGIIILGIDNNIIEYYHFNFLTEYIGKNYKAELQKDSNGEEYFIAETGKEYLKDFSISKSNWEEIH